jgi:hypothetical protein
MKKREIISRFGGVWRKLDNKICIHQQEYHWVIKSRGIIRVCSTHGRVSLKETEGKRHFGRPSVDRRIILKWILKKWETVNWTTWLTVAGPVNTIMKFQVA